MKVYKEYKEIEVKDIKGVKANAICSRDLEKVCRYMEVIKKKGIKKPFEVIQKENGYYVLDGGIRLLATKALGYDKVPCLIRDTKQKILLRKSNKIFKLEDENNEIKSDINDEEGFKSCRKNYYKLNI
jgi:ParB-like chromosome segregation protein Spo0J